MKISNHVLIGSVVATLSIVGIAGCGGGGSGNDDNDVFDSSATALCADGTRSPMFSTLQQAEAYCSRFGGVAPTPTPVP